MWNNKKVVFFYVKPINILSFKLDFQIVDKLTGGKWLIHGTNRRKNNQLQSPELSCRKS